MNKMIYICASILALSSSQVKALASLGRRAASPATRNAVLRGLEAARTELSQASKQVIEKNTYSDLLGLQVNIKALQDVAKSLDMPEAEAEAKSLSGQVRGLREAKYSKSQLDDIYSGGGGTLDSALQAAKGQLETAWQKARKTGKIKVSDILSLNVKTSALEDVASKSGTREQIEQAKALKIGAEALDKVWSYQSDFNKLHPYKRLFGSISQNIASLKNIQQQIPDQLDKGLIGALEEFKKLSLETLEKGKVPDTLSLRVKITGLQNVAKKFGTQEQKEQAEFLKKAVAELRDAEYKQSQEEIVASFDKPRSWGEYFKGLIWTK